MDIDTPVSIEDYEGEVLLSLANLVQAFVAEMGKDDEKRTLLEWDEMFENFVKLEGGMLSHSESSVMEPDDDEYYSEDFEY